MTSSYLHYYYPVFSTNSPQVLEADVCIYGGTSGGIAAAVQTTRMGKTAVIAEFGRHLGGMTSGGLGATDIGNKGAIGGIAREFYGRLGQWYGRDEAWTFEPKVAEQIFNNMVAEAGIPVYFEQRLAGVEMDGGRISAIVMENGATFRARMFIDAGYEGDLMAAAGVTYTVGRESNDTYNEIYNGVQFGHPAHNFTRFVDPYVVEGDPTSGLLPGISDEALPPEGHGDHRVQAYNFRLCMSNVPENRLSFPRPASYDPLRYELLLRYLRAGVWDVLGLSTPMPHGKTDTNNYGGFSSDNIGRNYEWPQGDYEMRERIFQDHVTYHQGLMWFLANDERVPIHVREEVNQWGLPRDEFVETGHWPHQLYVREARRMVSDYVMTEHDCVGRFLVKDPVGLAAYTMDSHNCSRVVRGGRAINEGNVEIAGFTPYPIAYRAIVPRAGECPNLLVPVCLSASHIAFGSIRMEPVFMVLGQSAATAAALAIDAGTSVQNADYARLRQRLLHDKQVLAWPPEYHTPKPA